METKKFIVAECVKSNKSNNYVWGVYTSKNKKHYCKNAATALKYAFILKSQTGCQIDNATFRKLMAEKALMRPVQNDTPAAPAE